MLAETILVLRVQLVASAAIVCADFVFFIMKRSRPRSRKSPKHSLLKRARDVSPAQWAQMFKELETEEAKARRDLSRVGVTEIARRHSVHHQTLLNRFSKYQNPHEVPLPFLLVLCLPSGSEARPEASPLPRTSGAPLD